MWFKKKPDARSLPDAILRTVDTDWRPDKSASGRWTRYTHGRATIDVADVGEVWAWSGSALLARFNLTEASPDVRMAFLHTIGTIAITAFRQAAATVSQEREIKDVL